jgi:hypothetical protein
MYLGKAIRVSADDRDIASLGLQIVHRSVLLYCKVENIFLLSCCSPGVLSDVLTRDDMFFDSEQVR